MPIYEYKCRVCGNQFEYLVLPSSPTASCSSCRSEDLERIVSLCAISPESMRQSHLASARKKGEKLRQEKLHEEHKAMHEHYDD